MKFHLFMLPTIGRRHELEQGMAGLRDDLYQRMLGEIDDGDAERADRCRCQIDHQNTEFLQRVRVRPVHISRCSVEGDTNVIVLDVRQETGHTFCKKQHGATADE